MRLIDADELVKYLKQYHGMSQGIISDVEHFPTAHTAIEALEESKIITCKDCKYHCANYCTRDIKGRTNMFYMEDDAFCSEAIKAGEQR